MDRYNRAMLTIIAASTLLIAVNMLSAPPAVVHAQTAPAARKCVWTYILDNGAPSIGKDGTVELKGKNWQKLSEEGWVLKTTMVTSGPFFYMFERCE